MASRFRISLTISLSLLALSLSMAAASSLDLPIHIQHQRALLLVVGAAAAALVAAWTLHARPPSGRGLDVNALFGRQRQLEASLKRRPSTPPSRDDGSRELRDLPMRAPPPSSASAPAHRWHLLPTPHAPEPTPELTPAQRKYLVRVSERLRRAAAQHGLTLTSSLPTSLSLHAGCLTPPSSPSAGPRISLVTTAHSELRLVLSLHARDAEEACRKGWAARVTHHFFAVGRRDRHEVEVLCVPADDGELAVVLDIVDAGVKYLRSQAADFLCNEILDLVF